MKFLSILKNFKIIFSLKFIIQAPKFSKEKLDSQKKDNLSKCLFQIIEFLSRLLHPI